jgi:hypothetical protein
MSLNAKKILEHIFCKFYFVKNIYFKKISGF